MSNTPIKRKDRKKLNVIDVVIILLLVALVGTAGYSIYNEITKSASSAQSNIVVVFEAQVEDEGIIEYPAKIISGSRFRRLIELIVKSHIEK